jgi:hypothetical protein
MDNEAHWRDRAKEARAVAEKMSNSETRRTMLDIARQYDQLADRARERSELGARKSKTSTQSDQPQAPLAKELPGP